VEDRKPTAIALAAAGLAALAALYAAFPERLYVFDGVVFAGVIERSVDDWRQQLFNHRHLLFNPLMMALREILLRSGARLSGYDVMQRVNAVAGALGVGVLFALVRRITKDVSVSLCAALLLAVSSAYWARAVEGQAYMLMTLGALAALNALAALEDDAGSLALAGVSLAAAIMLHAANAVLIVPALAACAARGGSQGPRAAKALGGAWLAALGAYALVFMLRGADDPMNSFGGLLARLWHGESLGPWGRVLYSLDELGSSVVFGLWRPWSVASGALLAAGAAAAARAALSDAETRRTAAVPLSGLLAFAALDAFWVGGAFFWATPLALLIALASLPAARALRAVPRRGPAMGLAAVCVFLIGGWNLRAGIRPQSRVENNAGYRAARFVAEHTVPTSWILISGFRGFPNAKVYLTYFARRGREPIDSLFESAPKDEALGRLRAFLRRNMSSGVPIYLLSDLVEDPETGKEMARRWGLNAGELGSCLGPGALMPVARSRDRLGVFLYVPRAYAPQLFAGLSYAALNDGYGARLDETFTALQAIAARMSPVERVAAGEILKSSDDGAKLLSSALLPSMSAENRESVRRDMARFDQARGSNVSLLRLGSLYRMLGLTSDARRAWTQAYRLSKDPEVARELSTLR